MSEKTCKTCIDNDCGLCDQKGIMVEDDDGCENHKSNEPEWKQSMIRTFLAGQRGIEVQRIALNEKTGWLFPMLKKEDTK